MCVGVHLFYARSSLAENDDEPRLMGWNLTPEDLVHIPQHWLTYPEIKPIDHYIIAFGYTILFILGVIGNGLVLWIFSM